MLLRAQTVRMPMALAIVAGVPALVFVSVGPVALVVGPGSIALWAISAGVGMLMAVVFASLVSGQEHIAGGIAGAGAAVFRSSSRSLSVLTQWSYWLGWSPALGISAALIVELVHTAGLPAVPAGYDWLLGVSVMLIAALLNQHGICSCARVQVTLTFVCIAAAGVLLVAPIVEGTASVQNLEPFSPLGEGSMNGLLLAAGGLFLAGWSAYGAEVALTYGPEYEHRSRAVPRTLTIIAVITLVVYAMVPALLISDYGSNALGDPVASLMSQDQSIWVRTSAVVTLSLSVLLTLNMISASDSRVLLQMSANGDIWHRLGHLSSNGAPRNALLFDVGVNAVFLAIGIAVNSGNLFAVPTTLLTAANVAYFLSLGLALVAAAVKRRREFGKTRRVQIFTAACVGLVAFNAALLSAAAVVWGAFNVGLGVAALFGGFAVIMLCGRRGRAVATAGLRVAPAERLCALCQRWTSPFGVGRMVDVSVFEQDGNR